MISLEKLTIMTPLQKLPKNVGDLGKLIVFKKWANLGLFFIIHSNFFSSLSAFLYTVSFLYDLVHRNVSFHP